MCAALTLPDLPRPGAYVPLALGALTALRFRRLRWVVWAIAGFVWTAQYAEHRLADRLAAAGDFAFSGWVDDFPSRASGQATFSLSVSGARPAGVPARVRLTWYDPPPELAAGATLRLVARLRPPRGLRNPGGFDYERWLMIGGYGATGYVRSATFAPAARPSLARAWLKYRARLARRIAAASPDADARALLTALALGERSEFTARQWADFRRTGTSHLVAVSGMHVGLLALALFVAVRRLWLLVPGAAAVYDLEVAAAVSALGASYYAALTGFALPAQRSWLMILTALGLAVGRRSVGAFQGLAAALLAVLVRDPLAPLSASFWLSFGAVAVLLWLALPRAFRTEPARIVHRALAGARGLVRWQWGLSAALLPLTALFFGQVSLVGPVVNLAAVPWFSFVLVPAAVATTLVLSPNALAATVGVAYVHAIGALGSATLGVLDTVAAQPWAALRMPMPPWPSLGLAAAGMLLALPAHPLPGRKLAWMALLPVLVPLSSAPREGAFRLLLLDVGHGLAVIVETHAHRLVFDAGPRFPSGYDTGEEVVVPALYASGRRDLDLVVVSHADNDHAGGAAAVLAAFPHARVLKGPDVTTLGGSTCTLGEHWRWDGVDFRMLHPPAGFVPRGNDSSCVLRVTAGARSALIAADIEARGERAVGRQGIRAAVVIVPHHGSATSSSPAFVGAVRPKAALVSAAHGSRWGFPKPEVRSRWQQAGAAVFVTGDTGALTVRVGADGVRVRGERARRRHFWDARS